LDDAIKINVGEKFHEAVEWILARSNDRLCERDDKSPVLY